MKHTVDVVSLSNGSKGLFIDVPGATVMSFQFQFRAGNRYVKSHDIYETAHLMEHMAFGANANFKSEHAYEAEFTKNGAYHNAYTSDLSMVYVADCADFEWDRILDLQEVAICSPRFNEEEMQAEKGNVRSELTGYLNNHNRLLWPRVQQLLGEDVFSFTQRIKTIPSIELQDIKEHHKRTHTSDNLRFVIAGKLKGRKAGIIRQLESWNLPRGVRFDVPQDKFIKGKPTLIRRKEASNLTFGVSMMLSHDLSDEQHDAMNVLDHILTGTMHSRIYGAARKKGLAYGVFSDTSVGSNESSWDFGGQVNLETSEGLFDIIIREVGSVLHGRITEEELNAAKSYALGRYQMGAQTIAQISNFYTSRFFADSIIKDYEKVPDTIVKTTKKCIEQTAHEFISHDTWVLAGVSAGERADIVRLSEKFETLFKNEKITSTRPR